MRFQQPAPNSGRFTPTSTNDSSPDALHPVFSLRYVDKKFCITKCEKDEKASFVNKLLKWSQMSWAEIKQADRHGLGHEIIAQLKDKLPANAPEDAHALAFRFSGKAAMIGFRKENIFYPVWFDREFKLYNH